MKLTKEECIREYDDPEKCCPTCDEESCQDGRTLECVNQYASTCDGCAELTNHEEMEMEMEMDKETQLGYCPKCVEEKNAGSK